MNTFKKAKVIMVPTEKKSQIYFNDDVSLSYYKVPQSKVTKGIHLYMVSEDEIKEGDWYIHNQKPDGLRILQHKIGHLPMDSKKIIATTDKYLYPKCDGKCANNECVCLFPQIPESFIQAYIKAYNEPIIEAKVELIKRYAELLEKLNTY